MTIEAPAGVTGVGTARAAARPPKQAIDSEVFLQLLVAQLRNQDPSSPMDTNQMIAQSTQLAMMEQLSALAKTGTDTFSLQMRATAAELLGQLVDYRDDDGGTATGRVDSVSFGGSVPALMIAGTAVRLDALLALNPSTTS